MNVTVDVQPRSLAVITVEVEPERYNQALDDAFRRLAQEVVVPGFRKGRAPRHLIERHLGKDTIREEAEQDLLRVAWQVARKELGDRRPFASPHVDVVQRMPFIVKFTAPLSPTVKLGDYKSIRIPPELVTVTDEDVDAVLQKLREDQAQWVPVEDRSVRVGDQVTLDLLVTANEGMLPYPPRTVTVVSPDAPLIVPGFAMRLVDMRLDEQKQFQVELPAHPASGVPPTQATVSVAIREIKERSLPALDDDLAKTLQVNSLSELREKVRTSLLLSRERDARNRLEHQILDAIAAVSAISYPDILVDEGVQELMEDISAGLRQSGIDMDAYLRIRRKTREQEEADLRPTAEKRLRNGLLLNALADAEGITVDEADISAEIGSLAAMSKNPVDTRRTLNTGANRRSIANRLRTRRILDRLIAIVTEGQTPVPRPAKAAEQPLAPPPRVVLPGEEDDKTKAAQPELVIATH